MKQIQILKTTSLVTALLLIGMAHSAMAGVVVVVSAKNSVSSLSKEQVSKIFLGKTKAFPTGRDATAIDQERGEKTRDKFYKDAVKKSDSQVNAYWARKIFTGKGQPPRTVFDDSEVIDALSADQTAIGYIKDSSVNSRVKVVLTLP